MGYDEIFEDLIFHDSRLAKERLKRVRRGGWNGWEKGSLAQALEGDVNAVDGGDFVTGVTQNNQALGIGHMGLLELPSLGGVGGGAGDLFEPEGNVGLVALCLQGRGSDSAADFELLLDEHDDDGNDGKKGKNGDNQADAVETGS
jgi:hypothetical protein